MVMTTWIALLRGVNVGGSNRLAMTALAETLERAGLEDVRTVIQSGNVIFHSAEADQEALSETIASAVDAAHGFRPEAIVLTAEALERAIAAMPFAGDAEPQHLHLYFLAEPPPAPDLAGLEAARAESERFHLADDVLYLMAPEGIGRSKLAAKAERLLGVEVTARNLRSLERILAAARDPEGETP